MLALKYKTRQTVPGLALRDGFSLVETLAALAIVSILSLGLINLLLVSERASSASREQLQSVQVLERKLESIRAFDWSQILTPGFIPETFCETNGAVFWGRITIRTNTISESYKSNLLEVTLTADWIHAGRTNSQQLSTYISAYGLATSSP